MLIIRFLVWHRKDEDVSWSLGCHRSRFISEESLFIESGLPDDTFNYGNP